MPVSGSIARLAVLLAVGAGVITIGALAFGDGTVGHWCTFFVALFAAGYLVVNTDYLDLEPHFDQIEL